MQRKPCWQAPCFKDLTFSTLRDLEFRGVASGWLVKMCRMLRATPQTQELVCMDNLAFRLLEFTSQSLL